MRDIRTTAVIGAGTMGHGFAQLFAMNGIEVRLVDETEELLQRARGWITDNLSLMVDLGEIKKEEIEPVLKRIQFTTDMKQAAREADFVLEAVFEDINLKKRIFRDLDAWTPPDVILASNTSSFDINELSPVVAHPERVIGTHGYNPPQITPCVEVIPTKATGQETIDATFAFLKRVGKVPTRCTSAPGFVGNRIQFAMAAEALAIVEEGLATPEEVDQIVKTSFGFRLSAYGPFEISDLAGLDVYDAIFKYLYGKLKREQFRPPAVLEKMIADGRYGVKSQRGFYEHKEGAADALKRERDKRLYRRLRLFREEEKG
jgi:3-hydroxybutyryl-CoA dehydrogenase